MKASRFLPLLVGCVLLVIGVCVWVITRPSPTAESLAPAETAAPNGPPPGATMAASTGPVEPVAIPAPEIPPDQPAPKVHAMVSPEAVRDMDDVQFMLRDFRARLGGNPGGTNAEIMKAVMGGNTAHAQLGPPTGQQMNDAGELLDRWGTPYFFHQISAKEMEVRSYGPDRTMYTADDIVVK